MLRSTSRGRTFNVRWKDFFRETRRFEAWYEHDLVVTVRVRTSTVLYRQEVQEVVISVKNKWVDVVR